VLQLGAQHLFALFDEDRVVKLYHVHLCVCVFVCVCVRARARVYSEMPHRHKHTHLLVSRGSRRNTPVHAVAVRHFKGASVLCDDALERDARFLRHVCTAGNGRGREQERRQGGRVERGPDMSCGCFLLLAC